MKRYDLYFGKRFAAAMALTLATMTLLLAPFASAAGILDPWVWIPFLLLPIAAPIAQALVLEDASRNGEWQSALACGWPTRRIVLPFVAITAICWLTLAVLAAPPERATADRSPLLALLETAELPSSLRVFEAEDLLLMSRLDPNGEFRDSVWLGTKGSPKPLEDGRLTSVGDGRYAYRSAKGTELGPRSYRIRSFRRVLRSELQAARPIVSLLSPFAALKYSLLLHFLVCLLGPYSLATIAKALGLLTRVR